MKDQHKNDNYKPYNEDEIDVMELFATIGKGLKNVVGSIGDFFLILLIYFRNFCLNWFKLIIPAMLIGLGVGVSFNFITYTSYESEATIKSTFLEGANFINEIDKLNKLCSKPEGLAKVLQLDLEEALSIKSISAQGFNKANNMYEQYGNLEQEQLMKDSLIRKDLMDEEIFKIKIDTDNEVIAPAEIQKSLKRYLETNEYIVKAFESEKEGLEKEKELLENQSVELHKLRKTFSEAIKVRIENEKAGDVDNSAIRLLMDKNQSSFKNDDIPVMLLDKDLLLTQKLNEVTTKLYTTEKIQFITPFSPFYTKSYSRPTYGLLGAVMGFAVVFVLAMLLDLNAFLDKKSKESNYRT